jgi:hypothetical protein
VPPVVASRIVDLVDGFIEKSRGTAPIAMRELMVTFEDGKSESYRVLTADLADFLINLFADRILSRDRSAPGVYAISIWTHVVEAAAYGRCVKVGEPLYLYHNPARMPAEEREWLEAQGKEP